MKVGDTVMRTARKHSGNSNVGTVTGVYATHVRVQWAGVRGGHSTLLQTAVRVVTEEEIQTERERVRRLMQERTRKNAEDLAAAQARGKGPCG